MKSGWMIGLTVLALSVSALGQDAPQRGARQRGDRGTRGRFQPPPPVSLTDLAGQLQTELGLSEEQTAQVNEIAAKYQQQIDEQMQNRDKMRQLAMAYREARQAGDETKAAAIREEMSALGTGRGRVMNEFFTDVSGVLDETQAQKFEQFRTDFMEQRRGAGRGPGDMRQLLRDLPDQLNLTEEQRAEFAKIMEEHRQTMQADREQWMALRPLMDQLREAREAGDQARVAELEAELQAKRPTRQSPDEVFAQIEPILTDAQKAKLAELRASEGGPGAPGEMGAQHQARTILRAVMRLDLKPEQREKVRELSRDAMKNMRGKQDAATEAQQAEALKTQILELLDADQKAEFEQALERIESGGRGARPGQPGAMQGQGGRGAGHRGHRGTGAGQTDQNQQ